MTTNIVTTTPTESVYRTNSLALCPYLAINDLVYMGSEMNENREVVFMFKDPRNIGAELAMSFMKSKERMYKNMWNFFRNEIDATRKRVGMVGRLIKSKE